MKRKISILSLIFLTFTAFPQTASAPSFEVASVRRDPTTAGSYFRYLPGGRFSALSWMKQVIQVAYGVKDYQVAGGPGWLTTDWYDIEAKAENPDATKSDVNAMVRSLLADRFRLQFHREAKDFASYDLVVDKKGPKLTPLQPGQESKCSRDNSTICGITSPSELASFLGHIMGRPVFDKTGISGKFDVLLDFDTYSVRGQTPPEGYDKPSLSTALKEQLGLRLESRKERLPVMVVDRIERPTEN